MAPPLLKNDWHDGCSWHMTDLKGDEIPLTHEFLSLMLGVRRAGVTVALNYLEQRALISLSRKRIVITDRKGLEATANGTYYKTI